VITFKDFPGGEQQRQALVGALRDKISEFIIVESPEQTVRLISVDLAPSKRDPGPPTDGLLFLVKFNRIRKRKAEEDQAVWALFPLTEDQVKGLFKKMEGVDINKAIAELVKENKDYPFVELEEPDTQGEHPEGWPASTGRFNNNFDPAWYVIPAQPDENGMVEKFSRSLEIGKVTPPEDDRWVALMYVFHQKEKTGFPWRAVTLPSEERERYAPYSTPYVIAFKMTDLAALAKYKENMTETKPDENKTEKKTTDPEN